jgi:exodeoxyribonuclease V alpha subunit
MLAELHDGARFAVKIAAPTGKAAARMVESIQNAKQDLRREGISAAILDAMPESASTIHRMLGSRYQSPYFKHDTRNPLAADLVIVDEASMVDLPLMAKLLDALPEACRLMLVGDREQLASVEPGRVYGDVCHAALEGGPLAGCLTTLTESRRFPSDSAIGKVSAAIHDGGDPAWAVLMEQAQQAELNVCDSLEATQDGGAFAALVTRSLSPYLAATTPEAALSAAGQFRILCALRKGPYGVQRMNKRVEGILSKAGLRPSGRFYDHRLILVTANTPALDLNNGDVGVVLAAKNAAGLRTGGLLAWFYGKDKQPRAIPVNLLPEHETAFAMTVHKSQGSEFPNVALVLPPQGDSPVLTRELVYTGLTRVKIDRQNQTGGVTVYCSKASFTGAVDRLTERISGLFRSTSAQAAPSCRDRGGSMALGR